MGMKDGIRAALARAVCRLPKGVLVDRSFFQLYESRGIHCTPVHFYQPIPNTQELDERIWKQHSELPGIDLRGEAQCAFVEDIARDYRADYDRLPETIPGYSFAEGHFGTIDAEILYSMVRRYRPRRMIEIGSGSSTLVSLKALADNEAAGGQQGEMVCIEPHPDESRLGRVRHRIRLIEEPVQSVALAEFESLGENDILFIDSSHVVRIASDVNYEFLEILPRLKRGVILHVHDIFLPAEYPQEWILEKRMFWTEQYLLQAFLALNDSFEVRWGSSYMHLEHPDLLAQHFTSYEAHPRWPGSFWMQRVR